MAVFGVAVAAVVAGIAGTVVFRLGWSEPEGVEFAREVMEAFDHDRGIAHGEDDPFRHIYIRGDGRFDAEWHRHCLVHDVNGDGDTEDAVDNDGTCPGPDAGLPDLVWHLPLPEPGGPARESALKWGVILGAFTALWALVLGSGFIVERWGRPGRRRRAADEAGAPLSTDQPATVHGQDPNALASAPTNRPLWANVAWFVIVVSLAAGMAGLFVSDGRWADSKNSEVAQEFLRAFYHGWFPHDDGFWHFYLDDDGRVGSELHRHCQLRDVNTGDTVGNAGTCPGPDTELPDLAWHPRFPDPRNPAFTDALKEGAVLAAATATALAAILAAIAIPLAARKNRRPKPKEPSATMSPPETPTN